LTGQEHGIVASAEQMKALLDSRVEGEMAGLRLYGDLVDLLGAVGDIL
jgi:hypothetical protein